MRPGGVGVLVCVLGSACGAAATAPTAPAPAAPRTVSVRVAGAEYYDTLASRSLPMLELNRRAEAASLAAQLDAREQDLLFDDHYKRRGRVVLLGVEGQAVVGFTLRRVVDMRYPTGEGSDGVGTPEWRDQKLTLEKDGRKHTYRLRAHPDGPTAFDRKDVALVRTFAKHDIALVYFPVAPDTFFAPAAHGAVVGTLGLERPTDFVRQLIDDSTALFGFKFVLVSEESFAAMEKGAKEAATLRTIVKVGLVLAAVAYVLPALGVTSFAIGQVDGALTSMATSSAAAGLWADALPIALSLGKGWLVESGHLAALGPDGQVLARLLLTQLPAPSSPEGRAIVQFVDAIVAARKLQAVPFDGHKKMMLFEPSSKVNLNYELVRQGYAKLDVSDAAALEKYPEFVRGAEDALVDGHNADTWRHDTAYVAALRALRAKNR